jgi:hypothetical protein
MWLDELEKRDVAFESPAQHDQAGLAGASTVVCRPTHPALRVARRNDANANPLFFMGLVPGRFRTINASRRAQHGNEVD